MFDEVQACRPHSRGGTSQVPSLASSTIPLPTLQTTLHPCLTSCSRVTLRLQDVPPDPDGSPKGEGEVDGVRRARINHV